MKRLVYLAMTVLLAACQKSDSDTIVPPRLDTVATEYPDWYTVKAPVDQAIQGVWGDIDKTLLISTMFTVFRSTDRGKTWQQVQQSSVGVFSVVQYRDTLLTMTGLVNSQALTHPDQYSVDDGRSWTRYSRRNYNPVFEFTTDFSKLLFFINPVTASNGVTYKINQVFLDGPTATTGQFNTPGVITATKRRIDLPQLHQLNSLYLDAKERLYIAGSDAVCVQDQNFSFCNSKGGRGVIYVSKKALP